MIQLQDLLHQLVPQYQRVNRRINPDCQVLTTEMFEKELTEKEMTAKKSKQKKSSKKIEKTQSKLKVTKKNKDIIDEVYGDSEDFGQPICCSTRDEGLFVEETDEDDPVTDVHFCNRR